MDTSELLKKVRKIEIKTKGLSKHLFSGEYHSAFKGRGMSFSEVRDYTYGDDVRAIDWNVTARTGNTSIKVFEEERELTMMLLVDVSDSTIYGRGNHLKSDILTEMSAVLAFSAITNNDKVGAILFSDQVERYIPPKKGKKTILRIIRDLITHENKSVGTNISKALEYLNNVQKKRAIVFVISDFIDQAYDQALSIAARRHDMIGIRIFDQSEQTLPNIGMVRLKDTESGEVKIINTSSGGNQTKQVQWFEAQGKYFEQSFTKLKCDTLDVDIQDDYVKNLLKFFKQRKGR